MYSLRAADHASLLLVDGALIGLCTLHGIAQIRLADDVVTVEDSDGHSWRRDISDSCLSSSTGLDFDKWKAASIGQSDLPRAMANGRKIVREPSAGKCGLQVR